ncbi:MAG: ThiF family adenylyltransferase [Eubacteriaceae bacterium]|nr:ThiF family adenylyltransferase [Eubacteriaceae bacterium]
MKGFKAIKKYDLEDDPESPENGKFSRQGRIPGWQQEIIKHSTVIVTGAGAIGNETLKNLALLGFGNIFICDMDTIETSNLTRTVLFTQNDVGKKKAKLAAERVREINLEDTACVDYFDGDIVYGLGDGVFRKADIVLGCLDNAETRMYVNKICMRYDIPYIDASIGGLNFTVDIMNGHQTGCFECNAPKYKFEKRFRESCDVAKRKALEQGFIPTVQTASAAVSGLQVQQACKILCDINPSYGVEIYMNGALDMMYRFPIEIDENCRQHQLDARYVIIETPFSCDNTLREFLEYTAKDGYDELMLDEETDKSFITTVRCPNCGKEKKIFQPQHLVFTDDYYCDDCIARKEYGENYINEPKDVSLSKLPLDSTDPEILDLPMRALGIPPFHVVPVRSAETHSRRYYELSADYDAIMPEYSRKHRKYNEK